MKLEGKSIAFLGDSITEGTGVDDKENNRYDHVIQQRCSLKPVFRRSTRKIPTFCFLESQKSNFTQPENPLFSTKFQCPIWAFFIEKIYFLWYNNSTS